MAEPLKPPRSVPTPGVTRPTQRVVGPIAPPVYTAGAKPGTRVAPGGPEPLVTEGMKARQRDIDKKRRVVASLRQIEDEENEERWRRGRAWIFRAVWLLVALGVYLKMQSMYDNKWPLLAVWVFMGVLLFVAVTWLLWYLDYSD
jgi:hypothetical protein